MKNRSSNNEEKREKINGPKSIDMKRKDQKQKKNIMRLGGGGLSLQTFANAKSQSNHYNPALIKKQREFYKNAKYVSKYKKSMKHQTQQNDFSSATRPQEDANETGDGSKMYKKNKKGSHGLRELYEKNREEEEKARVGREAIIQAKKEDIEKSNARRKATREKMFKKTRFGQPVMKYRIEHLLQTIQGSSENPGNKN